MNTITKVAKGTYRINHPATNAALTRHGGFATPRTITRCFNAIGLPGTKSLKWDIEFRRGNNSKRWYFRVTRNNNVMES